MLSLDLIIIKSHFERIKDVLTAQCGRVHTAQRECVGVCVCVFVGEVAPTGEAPLTSLPFVQSLGDSHHQKSMCVRAYVRLCVCECVSRFCKTNLSSVRRFSAIEPGFDHSATVNNAREATAHLQHRMLGRACACVCTCVRARMTGWSVSLLANATGQFFDVPPLGPLNLVSDTGTPTLILSL